MTGQTAFFVPNVAAVEQEAAYEQLAAFAQRPPQPPGERVRAISWTHNGESWDAIVGQRLKGKRTRKRTIRGKRTEVVELLSDSATVMAIFPGNPFIVVHDGAGSQWQNPFMAGRPSLIGYFADPTSDD